MLARFTRPFVKALCVSMLALVALPAAGTPAALLWIGPRDPGNAVKYHITFDGHFWNGEKRAFANDIALVRGADRTIDATVTSASAPAEKFAAVIGVGGSLVAAAGNDHVIGFNTVAALLAHAPNDLSVGSAWKADVPTPAGTAGSVLVPFDVRVASREGGRAILAATAAFSTTSTHSGFSVPLDYDVRMSAAFDDGRFARADYAATEVVHAGPQTQTMGWTWSLQDVGQ